MSVSARQLPANGVSSIAVSVMQHGPGWRACQASQTPSPIRLEIVQGQDLVKAGPEVVVEGRWRRDLMVGSRPGTVVIRVSGAEGAQRWAAEERVQLTPDLGDADEDGFPNATELVSADDRLAFRRWFAAIAASQARRIDPEWQTVHQDCAGLLRFAYKEALKVHDEAWLNKRTLSMHGARDVARYHYPDVPAFGTQVFRTGSRDQPHSASASARVLRDENTVFVARDPLAGANGDLLFFEHQGEAGPVRHSMILLKDQDDADTIDQVRVVYHTGPEGHGNQAPDGSGEVRLVTLRRLLEHPDSSWHPRAGNPAFSGVFRWRILE